MLIKNIIRAIHLIYESFNGISVLIKFRAKLIKFEKYVKVWSVL